MAAASSGSRFDILPMADGECLSLRLRRRDCPGPQCAVVAFSRGARRLVGVTAPAQDGNPCCRSAAAGCCTWATNSPSEIEPRLRLPASPDPVVALAIRAPAAWIRDRAHRPGLAHGRDRLRRLLEEFRSGCAGGGAGASPRPNANSYRGGRPGDFSRRGTPGSRVHCRRRRVSDQFVARLDRQSHAAGGSGPDLPAPARTNPSPFRGIAASWGFCIVELLPRAAVVDSREHRLHPPDRRHPAARRHTGGRCGADPIASRQREGARRTCHVDRPGTQ